jgi:hypothetical protein
LSGYLLGQGGRRLKSQRLRCFYDPDCGTARAPGNVRSEAAAVLAVKGSEDYYTFQWADRGPVRNKPIDLNDAKWQDRLAKLGPIRICAPVTGEAPPYPSCLEQK